MKTENLTKASDSFGSFLRELREAHNDARDAHDGFAEMFIYSLLQQAAHIGWQLALAKKAAK